MLMLRLVFACFLAGSPGSVRAGAKPLDRPETSPLFAFCIDTHDARHRTLKEQAELLSELGYDGVGHLGLHRVRERLVTLDQAGLRLFWIHTTVCLQPDKPPFDQCLKEVLPLLDGRDVLLSVNIVGRPSSDRSVEGRALAIIRQISAMAEPYGVRVVLYHHVNQWVERIGDAVRIAKKVARPNVGVMFNLCHFLRVERDESLRRALRDAMPYLLCVSINGADRAEEIQAGRGRMIRPLGEGTFDVCSLLRTLREFGYGGPIGLQCWGLRGDARGHLTQSICAWRSMQQRLHVQGHPVPRRSPTRIGIHSN
ncbi:MAG TPA: sugar phosphate isomerase/epimerase [Planctomycetaceae bacterium]|nr:sugar phosphate isomerase/epimerase [Planctomycetaceae bacterium]